MMTTSSRCAAYIYDRHQPLPWAGSYRHAGAAVQLAPALTLHGVLNNVASAVLDLAQVCSEGMAVHYDIDSDGPATLALSDGRVVELAAGKNQGVF